MSLPPGIGELSYNGVTFDSSSTFKVTLRPQLTRDGRTVSFNLYVIDVEGYVTSDSSANTTTDTSMDAIRDALTATAGMLKVSAKGYGTFVINPTSGNSGVKDVAWGPIPTVHTFEPLGNAKAAKVSWTVEVRIPCSDADTRTGGLLEASYELRVSIDAHGRSKRTIDGYARMAATRDAYDSRTVPATIDGYKESLIPRSPPRGFRRTTNDWNVAADKASVTFSVVDEQWPGRNVPGPGITEAKASHRVVSKPGFQQWINTISASYHVADDASVAAAWNSFRNLIFDRYYFGKFTAAVVDPATGRKIKDGFVFPISWEFTEPEIYGSENAAFSFSYLLTTSGSNILSTSGLWRPVPDSNYSLWATSLGTNIWSPRGSAKLRHRTTDDAIVSLCVNTRTPTIQMPPGGSIPVISSRPPLQPASGGSGGSPRPGGGFGIPIPIMRPIIPPPGYSWLRYVIRLIVEEKSGTVIHRTLPKSPVKPKDPPLSVVGMPTRPPDIGQVRPPAEILTTQGSGELILQETSQQVGGPNSLAVNVKPPSPKDDYSATAQVGRIQHRATPEYFVTIQGEAARIAYDIPVPKLLTVGGAKAVPANVPGRHGFMLGNAAETLGGLPVRLLRFNMRYALDRLPGPIPMPYLPK